MLIINKFYNKDTKKSYAQCHIIDARKGKVLQSYDKLVLNKQGENSILDIISSKHTIKMVCNVAKSGDLKEVQFINNDGE